MSWERIIITEEMSELVKKICYKNWELNEDGTNKQTRKQQ